MRLSYSEDEDFPGQFNIWQANCTRSMKGKKGQAALRRLEAALVAMPTKRLIREELSHVDTDHGRLDVCALGAVAMMEDRQDVLYIDDLEAAGEALGIPRLVAWKVVEQNDIVNDTVWEVGLGPVKPGYGIYKGGVALVRDMTPEERYDKMLAWVRSRIAL